MFRTIAFNGITIERKVTSSSTNASPSTNANTIGACDFIESLKSRELAVMPVTCASAPCTRPIVDGITVPRSVLERTVRRVVGARAGERDQHASGAARRADVDADRLLHLAGRERARA